MEVGDRREEFLDDVAQLFFVLQLALCQIFVRDIVHDEEGAVLILFDVERPVLDDRGVVQFLEIDVALLELEHVLLL